MRDEAGQWEVEVHWPGRMDDQGDGLAHLFDGGFVQAHIGFMEGALECNDLPRSVVQDVEVFLREGVEDCFLGVVSSCQAVDCRYSVVVQ